MTPEEAAASIESEDSGFSAGFGDEESNTQTGGDQTPPASQGNTQSGSENTQTPTPAAPSIAGLPPIPEIPGEGEEGNPGQTPGGEAPAPAGKEGAQVPADPNAQTPPPAPGQEAGSQQTPPPDAGAVDLNSLSASDYVQNHLMPLVPDEEITFPNGEKINTKEFAEDFPEEFSMMVYLADLFSNSTLNAALANGEVVKTEDIKDILESHKSTKINNAITAKHEDGLKIIESKQFQEWTKQLPPFWKKAWESENVEDRIAVLDAYKGLLAGNIANSAKSKAATAKKTHDDLHGSSLKGQPGSASSATGTDKSEAEQAQEEDEAFLAAFGE